MHGHLPAKPPPGQGRTINGLIFCVVGVSLSCWIWVFCFFLQLRVFVFYKLVLRMRMFFCGRECVCEMWMCMLFVSQLHVIQTSFGRGIVINFVGLGSHILGVSEFCAR